MITIKQDKNILYSDQICKCYFDNKKIIFETNFMNKKLTFLITENDEGMVLEGEITFIINNIKIPKNTEKETETWKVFSYLLLAEIIRYIISNHIRYDANNILSEYVDIINPLFNTNLKLKNEYEHMECFPPAGGEFIVYYKLYNGKEIVLDMNNYMSTTQIITNKIIDIIRNEIQK